MTIIEYRKGNLIEAFKNGDVSSMVHCCNCFNTMGSGIALQIKNEFPEAYEADIITRKGDAGKLGTFTKALTEYGYVYNLYGQYNYGSSGARYVRYGDLYVAMKNHSVDILNYLADFVPIGIPKLGAGLAGGDWSIIGQLVEEAYIGHKVIVYSL